MNSITVVNNNTEDNIGNDSKQENQLVAQNSNKRINSIFNTLPIEIVCEILSYLNPAETISFIEATHSYSILRADHVGRKCSLSLINDLIKTYIYPKNFLFGIRNHPSESFNYNYNQERRQREIFSYENMSLESHIKIVAGCMHTAQRPNMAEMPAEIKNILYDFTIPFHPPQTLPVNSPLHRTITQLIQRIRENQEIVRHLQEKLNRHNISLCDKEKQHGQLIPHRNWHFSQEEKDKVLNNLNEINDFNLQIVSVNRIMETLLLSKVQLFFNDLAINPLAPDSDLSDVNQAIRERFTLNNLTIHRYQVNDYPDIYKETLKHLHSFIDALGEYFTQVSLSKAGSSLFCKNLEILLLVCNKYPLTFYSENNVLEKLVKNISDSLNPDERTFEYKLRVAQNFIMKILEAYVLAYRDSPGKISDMNKILTFDLLIKVMECAEKAQLDLSLPLEELITRLIMCNARSPRELEIAFKRDFKIFLKNLDLLRLEDFDSRLDLINSLYQLEFPLKSKCPINYPAPDQDLPEFLIMHYLASGQNFEERRMYSLFPLLAKAHPNILMAFYRCPRGWIKLSVDKLSRDRQYEIVKSVYHSLGVYSDHLRNFVNKCSRHTELLTTKEKLKFLHKSRYSRYYYHYEIKSLLTDTEIFHLKIDNTHLKLLRKITKRYLQHDKTGKIAPFFRQVKKFNDYLKENSDLNENELYDLRHEAAKNLLEFYGSYALKHAKSILALKDEDYQALEELYSKKRRRTEEKNPSAKRRK